MADRVVTVTFTVSDEHSGADEKSLTKLGCWEKRTRSELAQLCENSEVGLTNPVLGNLKTMSQHLAETYLELLDNEHVEDEFYHHLGSNTIEIVHCYVDGSSIIDSTDMDQSTWNKLLNKLRDSKYVDFN